MSDSLKPTSSFLSDAKEEGRHAPHTIDASLLAAAKDDNAQALASQDLDFSPEEERGAVRKLDLIMLPLMAFGTGFQLIDKSALGSAATLTLKMDLKLVGTQYNWAVTIYYLGLLVATWPANLLLQKYHTGRVTGIAFILWSTTMFGMLGVKNFGGLAACRFLLGVLESPMAPAYTLLTSRFWPQHEQPLRFALWTIANTVLPIPFTFIYYALGHIKSGPLEAWRYIFLLLGICTAIVGTCILFFLPDKPSSTWWLSPRRRAIIIERVAKSQVGIKSHEFKWYQVKEALLDIKVWMLVLMIMTQQAGVSLFTNFAGLIIKGFGYSGLMALLLNVPGWAVASTAVLSVGFLATKTEFFRTRKTWLLTAVTGLVIASAAVLYTQPSGKHEKKALLTIFVSLVNSVGCGYGNILALGGQNISGTTKKQTVVTLMFLGYCVSNICIPQAFLTREAPRYQTGLLTVMSCQCVLFVTYISFYLLLSKENRRKEQESVEKKQDQTDGDAALLAGLADETDELNPFFRYSA
ncbi:MFS general substrate transporter [Meredithblackwellia eburnea MCA 4105]